MQYFKKVCAITSILVLMSVSVCLSYNINFKFVHPSSDDSSLGKFVLSTQKSIEENYNGHLKIKIYGRGMLGDSNMVLEEVQRGTIDMAAIPYESMISLEPGFVTFNVPLAFNNIDHVNAYQRGNAGSYLAESLERMNLLLLGFFNEGMVNLSVHQDFDTPEKLHSYDFKTENFFKRVWEDSSNNPFIKEVILDSSFKDISKDVILTKHRVQGYVILCNLKRFQALRSEDQQLLKKAVEQNIERSINEYEVVFNNTIRRIKASGYNVEQLDGYSRSNWVEKIPPVWKKISKFSSGLPEVLKAGSNLQCAMGTCECLGSNVCTKECCE